MPAHLVDDCPRCNARNITFTVLGGGPFKEDIDPDLMPDAEILCMCRACYNSSIFAVYPKNYSNKHSPAVIDWKNAQFNIKEYFELIGVVTPADVSVNPPPQHLPHNIELAFNEGSKCLSVNCYNAAATMFRLCLDFATKALLPTEGEPAARIRRSLGLRMEWLFENGSLPAALEDLAECVKDDGNDGAHEGILDKESALDLEDFTRELLTNLYTVPARLAEAKRRREARHSSK